MSVADEEWRHQDVIAINEKNEIWMGGESHELVAVRTMLEEKLRDVPETSVMLIVHDDASAGVVSEVQSLLQELNIPTRIAAQ